MDINSPLLTIMRIGINTKYKTRKVSKFNTEGDFMDDTGLTAENLTFHARILDDASYRIQGNEKKLDAETRQDLIITCSTAISGLSQLVANLVSLEQGEAAKKSA